MSRRDPNNIGAVARWNEETGGNYGIANFLSQELDPEILLAATHLLWPDFVEVRGCLIRADAYESSNFESWWNETNGDRPRIESVLNHLHLWDVFPGYDDDAGVLGELADVLIETWAAALDLHYPDCSFRVDRDDHYGPGITFSALTAPTPIGQP